MSLKRILRKISNLMSHKTTQEDKAILVDPEAAIATSGVYDPR